MKHVVEDVTAWLTTSYSFDDLSNAKDSSELCSMLYFYKGDMTGAGWAAVGKATIELELFPNDGLVLSYIERLRKEKALIEAEAFKRCQALDEKIANLLALPAPQENQS